jgi:hypothetical protein
VLRDRGAPLRQALGSMAATASSSARLAALATINQLVAADQAPIVQAVLAANGVANQGFWVANCLAIEVPPVGLQALAALPRVRMLIGVREYDVGDARGVASDSATVPLPVPIAASTDALNHNVAAAWSILGTGGGVYRGAGARVAVFDTGIDADVNGDGPGAAMVHPAFLATPTGSRVAAHLRAMAALPLVPSLPNGQFVDVNMCRAVPPSDPNALGTTPPHGFRPGRHSARAAHGTTMAAIIAGRTYTNVGDGSGLLASFGAAGHAPDAMLVDLAASSLALNTGEWVFTEVAYLSAIQVLRSWIIANRPVGQTSAFVHGLNISVAGPPSPTHPVNVALDALARDEDILLVCNAGNQSDTTASSPGFHHGLSVGAVHTRTATDLSFRPMLESSTGPLFGDSGRFYPDLCATGAGPSGNYPLNLTNAVPAVAQTSCLRMPGIDVLDVNSGGTNVSPERWALGTSESAAQVSGAAALYRGFRASIGAPASMLETKAALLLNVFGVHVSASGTTSEPGNQHAYNNRNRTGVGYVRDDLLAHFAKRTPGIHALAQPVTISTTATQVDVPYSVPATGLEVGKRYGAVVCWPRWLASFAEEGVLEASLPDVDLEVWSQDGVLLAASRTPANSYERLVFRAPLPLAGPNQVSQVTLRVRLVSPAPTFALASPSFTGFVCARRFDDDVDPATSVADTMHAASGSVVVLDPGVSCTQASVPDWRVGRLVPTTYNDASGSAAYKRVFLPLYYSHAGTFGYRLAGDPTGVYESEIFIDASLVSPPGSPTMNIRGVAFRARAPFSGTIFGNLLTLDTGQGTASVSSSSALAQTWGVVGSPAGDSRPDGFNVFVDFGQSLSVSSASSLRLRVWGFPGFVVDGLEDGSVPQGTPWYRTRRRETCTTACMPGTCGSVSQQCFIDYPGSCPIIGLIFDGSVTSTPRLRIVGEPWVGTAGASHDVVWTLSHTVPGTTWLLTIGPVGTPLLGAGGCLSWLNGPIGVGTSFVTSMRGFESQKLALPAGFVHNEFGLQAVAIPSLERSNALRVRVGGGL